MRRAALAVGGVVFAAYLTILVAANIWQFAFLTQMMLER